MNKEQLIKMIELLPIEELNGFKIYYYSEKEKESYGSYNSKKREEHSISYGLDTTDLMMQKIERMSDRLQQNERDICRVGDMVQEVANAKKDIQ